MTDIDTPLPHPSPNPLFMERWHQMVSLCSIYSKEDQDRILYPFELIASKGSLTDMGNNLRSTPMNEKVLTRPLVGSFTPSGMSREDVARTVVPYLKGYDDRFLQGANDYYGTMHALNEFEFVSPDLLAMFAGQLCYQSFTDARTPCSDVRTYLGHIKEMGHGAVLEHVHLPLLIGGISRAASHELVRHRIANFSQVSQRYVTPENLRFVVRTEVLRDKEAYELFLESVDSSARLYRKLAERMAALARGRLQGDPSAQAALKELSRDERREILKQTRQVGRDCLPNATETAMVVTMNGRGWRNFLEQRCSLFADSGIQEPAWMVYATLLHKMPSFVADYVPNLSRDRYGIPRAYVTTPYKKV